VILFFISFVLVFVSSYFITSVIAPKRSIVGFLYLFIIAFAQIVLTFEVLSLFTAIKPFCVLGLNSMIFIGSIFLWQKNSKPLWSLDCKDFKTRVLNSLRLDKSLIWLFVGFLVLMFSAVFLCTIMPITSADGYGYHVARSLFWVLNGSLNHFEIADIRALCLPINSEILYAWVLLFMKKAVFLGFFSFVGYLLSIVSIYNILGFLGYCTRKKLWVIFILSSFSSVLVQISGTETDIIIAGLVTSSLFLFWYALKNNKITPIIMASLAYSLAIGTKTTSLIAIPGMGLLFLALAIYYRKKEFYKPLGWFLGAGLINFLIFASFNYILNFIAFSNFMGADSLMQATKNQYGFRAIPANFIKYIFMFFDFTGFRWSDYIGPNITQFRDSILSFLHLSDMTDGLYSMSGVNRTLLEPIMGAGILGFLVYLPCLVWSCKKPIFEALFKKKHHKKTLYLLAFGLFFVINLLMMSYLIGYMIFSVRFVMTFIVLSAPILIYSYLGKKNPLKYLIIAFALFYLTIVSTHLWSRPFIKIIHKLAIEKVSVTEIRDLVGSRNFSENINDANQQYLLSRYVEATYPKNTKILAFIGTGDFIYYLKSLCLKGYNIDIGRMENVKNIDISKYNIIISTNEGQTATVVKDYERRKNECILTERGIVLTDRTVTVPCIYKFNNKVIQSRNENSIKPYELQCILSSNFLYKNNLKPAGEVVSYGTLSGKPLVYKIYENTKFPPMRIKR